MILLSFAKLSVEDDFPINLDQRDGSLPVEVIDRILELGLEDFDEFKYEVRLSYLVSASKISRIWSRSSCRLIWAHVVLQTEEATRSFAKIAGSGKYRTRSLRLERGFHVISTRAATAAIRAARGVKALVLKDFGQDDHAKFPHPSGMQELPLEVLAVTTLKDLKSLTLINCVFYRLVASPLTPPFPLESFKIRQSDPNAQSDNIFSFLSSQPLSSLHFELTSATQPSPTTLNFFQTVAPYLHSLVLAPRFHIGVQPQPLFSVLQLSNILQHLQLRFINTSNLVLVARQLTTTLKSLTVDDMEIEFVLEMLETTAMTKLEALTLTVYSGVEGFLTMMDNLQENGQWFLNEMKKRGIEVKFGGPDDWHDG